MIHETAIVSEKADISEGVSIGPYSIIGPDVSIGSDTIIKSHVVITGRTKIGKQNHFYPFSTIGESPQDMKYKGEDTELEIGDRNTIRESCTINKGTAQDTGVTRLGDDNWIMAYVHIAHDCQIGNNTVFANNTTLGGHVEVGDYAIFGGFSGAHQFCKIGSHSFLAIYSGVAKDLPPYVMVTGQPAVPRGINIEGLKRRDFSSEQIRNIKNAYKLLYTSDLRLEEAVEKISGLDEVSNEIQVMLDFLHVSTRGIIR
ncbi:MAG: acyl-[acyl-carrier-protein]--UDP-N-acetylglucosamine O-acyltransferase [Gammaproteobacteria bacterium]|nr:acyl-[acyl-carrier-protein]--UDP-N-acetylglucosamine O-acyltransferase [Gammaproteobacteria bacterium]|tara:strand:- start:1667 stop:2437 length:771 start_codon:yes stop_codon:yes gene_type:complete